MSDSTERDIKKTSFKLMGFAGLMFAFAMWVMPPLYEVMCDVFLWNGKTNETAYDYETEKAEVDTSRTIKVQFVARNNDGMVWEFEPKEFQLEVHPGEQMATSFYAKNPTAREMIGQANPSISPARAAEYFLKTECFCFNQQTLAAGEEVDMPMRFVVDQALPKNIHRITLTYTLFDAEEFAKPKEVKEIASIQ